MVGAGFIVGVRDSRAIKVEVLEVNDTEALVSWIGATELTTGPVVVWVVMSSSHFQQLLVV